MADTEKPSTVAASEPMAEARALNVDIQERAGSARSNDHIICLKVH